MRSLLFVFCISLSCLGNAQLAEAIFPGDYLGVYKGNLVITNVNGTRTIGMEFHLKETNTIGKYQYVLVYISNGSRQERLYNLVEKNADEGTFVIDENNGIFIDAKFVNNTLFSMFEVQDNIITTTERFYKNGMDFEITFASKKNQNKSGTTGKDNVEVTSYPISVVQKAFLKRISD